MHILVVEDEKVLCETIVRSLRRLDYSVDSCYDGNEAIELLSIESYDLVLLDLNLPGTDGMTVLRKLRQTDRDTKVLILSARSEVADKVDGLDSGANDYLSKPFHLEELEARIRSLTRRQFTQNDVVLTCGDISFDTKSRTASAAGLKLTLTRKESAILEYLLLNRGRPVSQEELIDHVWDNSVDNFSNSIRVHISALRKKLRAALGYDPIRNRIGEGYVMEDTSYEEAFFAMAHHFDDRRLNRRDLRYHELPFKLFRQTLYGFHRFLCFCIQQHRRRRTRFL